MIHDGPALVTGALGQDGFILCQKLRALRIEVVGIARCNAEHIQRASLLEKIGCKLLFIDLNAALELTSLALSLRPGSIFHLAAAHHSSAAPKETPQLWRSMIDVNFSALEVLARAAVTIGEKCSMVYASSSQIWNATTQEQLVDEQTPVDPSTFYGHTKVWSADLLHQYREKFGLCISIGFLFNHESPWRAPNFVTRKITLAAARASLGIDGGKLQLLNVGARADWQAAEDVVEALVLMARASKPNDFVLASGHSHSVADIASMAYSHVGLDWREWIRAEKNEIAPNLVGLSDLAKRELGWTQKWDLSELIRTMVDADMARLTGRMEI
jgi:GDPmannose 4,6-dehydratase